MHAQKLRLQAAFQPENARIDAPGLLPVRDTVANLPRPARQPVDQRGHDEQAEQVAANQGVERQIEQVERERQVEYGVVPGCRARQIVTAEITHHGPGVNGCRREKDGNHQHHDGGKFRVERVASQARPRKSQRPRMGSEQDGEGQDRGRSHRRQAVEQHAQPGFHLADFAPPLILDDVGGDRARAQQDRDNEHD